MKTLLALFLALITTVFAEEVTLRQSAMLKADRSIVALKAGTVVELLSRDGETVTIKYKELTGKIPASKLEAPSAAAPAKAPAAPPAAPAPANPPQTMYGKAVQKAKDNAEKHKDNLVDPANEVLKDK